MMILLTKLGEKKNLGIMLSNIRYLEEYEQNHSRLHLLDNTQPLYIDESLEEVCELINNIGHKNTVSINVYHNKSLFAK